MNVCLFVENLSPMWTVSSSPSARQRDLPLLKEIQWAPPNRLYYTYLPIIVVMSFSLLQYLHPHIHVNTAPVHRCMQSLHQR